MSASDTQTTPPEASTSTSVPPVKDIATAAPENPDTASEKPVLSKNAQKRLARQAHRDALKPERRQKEKAARKEKQAQKRKLVEDGADPYEVGLLKRPRMSKQTPFPCNILIDLSFDDKMIDKELKSMSTQLAHVYNVNRNAMHPVNIVCTPMNGRLKERMDTVGRAVYTRWKGMNFLEDSLETLWKGGSTSIAPPIADSTDHNGKEAASSPASVQIQQEDVIYLTADSPNILDKLEEGKSYVIGGIVDHNRYKNMCYDIAQEKGIGHAALPIGQYIELATRKVLTVNQCFEIMSKWLESHDWEKAFYEVIPKRKFDDKGKKGRKDARSDKAADEVAEDGSEGEEAGQGQGRGQADLPDDVDAATAKEEEQGSITVAEEYIAVS